MDIQSYGVPRNDSCGKWLLMCLVSVSVCGFVRRLVGCVIICHLKKNGSEPRLVLPHSSKTSANHRAVLFCWGKHKTVCSV